MKKIEVYNMWKKLGLDEKQIDLILQKITGLTKSQLFLNKEIDNNFLKKIEKYFSRVIIWEPLEYILWEANFYGFDFYVDSRILIPRNDTEILVEQTIKEIKKSKNSYILIDVWTGSSCIPISILKNTDKIIKTFVIDISKEALEVSKINIEKYNFENDIIQINSDLLNNFSLLDNLKNNFKNVIITANLPYIKNWDFLNMDKSTIEFEPDLALYWWEKTWFELYEKLILQIINSPFLFKRRDRVELWVILFIEIWFDQKEIAKNFLQKQNLEFEIFKDNSWIDRCIKIYF